MEQAVATALEELALPMLTATVDRGKEFASHDNVLEEHGLTFYFADPYSSRQRGSNENVNVSNGKRLTKRLWKSCRT